MLVIRLLPGHSINLRHDFRHQKRTGVNSVSIVQLTAKTPSVHSKSDVLESATCNGAINCTNTRCRNAFCALPLTLRRLSPYGDSYPIFYLGDGLWQPNRVQSPSICQLVRAVFQRRGRPPSRPRKWRNWNCGTPLAPDPHMLDFTTTGPGKVLPLFVPNPQPQRIEDSPATDRMEPGVHHGMVYNNSGRGRRRVFPLAP